MAYNLNQYSDQGGNANQNNDKINIFDQSMPNISQSMNGGQQGFVQKSDSGSSFADSGSSGGSQNKPQGSMNQSTSSNAALAANSGKTALPTAFGKATQSLADADKATQDEANSYASTQKNSENFNVPSSQDVSNYVKTGDSGAGGKISGLFSQTAAPVDTFAPKTNLLNADVEDLTGQTYNTGGTPVQNPTSNGAGIEKALQKDNNANYTSGMANFDYGLLQRGPELQNVTNALSKAQQGLLDKYSTISPDTQKAAQDQRDQDLAAARNSVRSQLGSSKEDILNQAGSAAEALSAKLRTDRPDYVGQQKAKAMADFSDPSKYSGLDPRVQALISGQDVSPWDYGGAVPNVYRDQMITGDQASSLNNIEKVLGLASPGQTSMYTPTSWAAGSAPSLDNSFDLGGYENALLHGAGTQRDTIDKSDRSQISDLLNNITNRESESSRNTLANQAALDLNPGLQDEFNVMQEKAGIQSGNYGKIGNLAGLYQGQNYENDLGQNYDVTADEAAKLNSLNQDLGQQSAPYAAGAGGNVFNESGYRSAAEKAMQDYINNNTPAKVAPPNTLKNDMPKAEGALQKSGNDVDNYLGLPSGTSPATNSRAAPIVNLFPELNNIQSALTPKQIPTNAPAMAKKIKRYL